nr:PKD domain-containing protein [Candidatus Sigynarchaeota archaeon]
FIITIQNTAPVAIFSANRTTVGAGDSVQLTFTGSEGDAPASFSWNFGDGSGLSTLPNPSHRYLVPGNYTVTLIVIDSTSDQDTCNAVITVVSYPGILAPIPLYVTFMQGSLGTVNLNIQDVTSGSGKFTVTAGGMSTAYTNVSWVNSVPASIQVSTNTIGNFIYTIEVVNANGFSCEANLTVFIDDYPAITAGSPDFSISVDEGSVFLNWTVVDTVGALTGTYIVYRDGTRVGNGTWISGERVTFLADLNLPRGTYNYTIHVTFTGSNGWYIADTVMVTITKAQTTAPFFEEYWYVFVAGGVAVAVGIVVATRKRGAAKTAKKASMEKSTQKRLALAPPPPMVGKIAGKIADDLNAKASPADGSEERKFSANELKEIKATAEEVTAFKQAKICIVHKGPITGMMYICPQCDSIYCIKCATHLKESGQKCWSCGADVLKSEEKTEMKADGNPEKKEVAKFFCATCNKYQEIENPDFNAWINCPDCKNAMVFTKPCTFCSQPIALTKELYATSKGKLIQCPNCAKDVLV